MSLRLILSSLLAAVPALAQGAPLAVTDVKVETTASTVTVRWHTSAPADSRLFYSPSRSLLSSPKYVTLLRKNAPVMDHRMTISHLPGGLPLYLRVESQTAGGETARSEPLEARTAAYQRSFLCLGPFVSPSSDLVASVVQADPAQDALCAGGKWQFRGTLDDHLDLNALSSAGRGHYFLSCWVFAPEAGGYQVHGQSARPAKVWLNRKPLAAAADAGDSRRPQVFAAPFQRGWNLFLARVETRAAGEGFSCRFIDAQGKDAVFHRVAFVDPRPRLEVQVEKLSATRRRVRWEFRHPYVNPKWIQSGWGRVTLSDLEAHLPEMEERGRCFDGVTLRLDDGPGTQRGGFRPFATDIVLRYEALAPQAARIRRLRFQRWTDNFAWVSAYLAGEPSVDWLFDDQKWSVVLENFRVIARFVREAGLKGIFFDCETPRKPPVFTYANGLYEKKYPDAAAVMQRARERGGQLVAAIQALCPDLVVISVDGSRSVTAGLSLFQMHRGRLEESSTRPGHMAVGEENRLFPAFLAGMIAGAQGRTQIIDGEFSRYFDTTIDGPARTARLWWEVLPHWTDDPDQMLEPSQWITHGGVSGRVNSYEAPGIDQPDAGMPAKLEALSHGSYADYLWFYWQSYVPGFGWPVGDVLRTDRREEMERRLKNGTAQRFTPTLLEGKPEEFFAAMNRARETLGATVTLELDGQAIPVPQRGERVVEVPAGRRVKVKLVGRCDAGEAVWAGDL